MFQSSSKVTKDHLSVIANLFKGFQRIFQFFQSSKVTKDHLSVVANPASPADPVNVFLDLGRHVEVHHIGNLVEWCLSMVYQLPYQTKQTKQIVVSKQNLKNQ